MKKFRICHFIQSRDHEWFFIKPNSFLCFSIFNQWHKMKCGMKFYVSAQIRIFCLEKALKILVLQPLLPCSVVVSSLKPVASGSQGFFWAHLVKRLSLLWRKPNPLMDGSGYKKNAYWIKNKNPFPFISTN